jgi:hypothetical protein
MAIRRIKQISETYTFDNVLIDIVNDLTKAHADFAVSEKNRVMKRPVKRPSKVKVFVGGREGADEHTVKPGEKIEYQFDYLKSIVLDAHKRLRANSPIHRGPTKAWGTMPDRYVYRDSHIVFVDGQMYDDPSLIPDTAGEVIITNLMPYARMVELRGWGKSGGTSFRAPYHTYELTAAELKRYSNFINIKFTFVDMPGFAAGKTATKSDQSRSIRYPALIITPR